MNNVCLKTALMIETEHSFPSLELKKTLNQNVTYVKLKKISDMIILLVQFLSQGLILI